MFFPRRHLRIPDRIGELLIWERTWVVLVWVWVVAGAGAGRAQDYLTTVKPILAQHCYRCHGASQQKGGLRLDTAAGLMKGGDSGPGVRAGDPAGSILLQTVLGAHEEISRMPYKKPPLSEESISHLRKWVESGAAAPAQEEPSSGIHWAFVAPERPALPAVSRREWARTPVDLFVGARLEEEKIEPSPEADRVTLLRRVTLDLTGLPPTPEEVRAFLADRRSDAYEQWVERLLGSPRYGERWGRLWLDVARYADSHGYSIDAPRQMWPYRDWVIRAFNEDMGFDEFILWQLAGDLLPEATLDQRIATGFHRNTPINEEGGIDKEQFRIESVFDRVNTTATAFLGVTLACAQCHDHKFDPFTQKDYYRMFAFLNDAEEPSLEVATAEQLRERDRIRGELRGAEEALRKHLEPGAQERGDWLKGLGDAGIQRLDEEARQAAKKAAGRRSLVDQAVLHAAWRPDDAEGVRLAAAVRRLQAAMPVFPRTLVMAEREKPRESRLFIQGDFTRLGEPVTPGVPEALHPLRGTGERRPTRLDLARWLVDPKNPLTARVTVNRIWQQYFGRGLVETENDFGTQGIPPTHPELLDWLASEFVGAGWSQKAVHRLIVLSATYRQSSRVRRGLDTVDASNRMLARQNRLRLDAEVVRDVGLIASGLLVERLGGPGVFPPQPDGVMTLGQSRREWKADTGANRFRRGLYTYFWRATPHPGLMVFDAADGVNACTRRVRSNTPLQALTLLNDEAAYEFAVALAERLMAEGGGSDADRIRHGFRLALAREAEGEEVVRLEALLSASRDRVAADESPGGGVRVRRTGGKEPWIAVARVLLNLDETITRE